MANDIDPDTYNSFTNMRNNYGSNYLQNTAGLQSRMAMGAQQYGNQYRDMGTQYGRQRNRLPGQFMGRGMLKSGMYNRGRNEFNIDKATAFGNLAQQYAQQQQGWGQEQAGYGMTRDQGYLSVEQGMAQARAAAVARM